MESSDKSHHQIWFADDAASTGSFDALHDWLAKLVKIDPSCGYFVNPGKTWLIVKDKAKLVAARSRFDGFGINITSKAKKHLGAWLGDKSSISFHLQIKVDKWINTISLLSLYQKLLNYSHMLLIPPSPTASSVNGCTLCTCMHIIWYHHFTATTWRCHQVQISPGHLRFSAPEQLQASVEISQPLSDAIIEHKPYDREVTSQQHQAKTRI